MISLWVLIKGFSIIGITAFGGGATMIKLIQETFVEKYNIVDPIEFASILGVTFLFPGLTGVKLAAIIGFKSSGILGAITAIIALNIAMLASALVDLIRPNISNSISWVAILLTLILFVLVSFFNVPAILALIMFLISFVLFV